MNQTKLKPTETIGDDLPILKWQIKRIMQDCAYQVETKNEYVQWVTGDVNRTSLTSITQAQAVRIMQRQNGILTPSPSPKERGEGNWAVFNKTNPKHKIILSLLYQMQWVKPSEKWGEVPDLERLSSFLQSEKSPVRKPLKDMEPLELEKLIKALSGIVKSKYK